MKTSYLTYIFALLLFGANGIVASFISLNSSEIVLLRTCIGSLLLLFLFLLSKQKFTFYRYKKQTVFLVFSGISMGISWMLLYEAYAQIGVGISSLLYYCGPIIVMILSPVVFKERLTILKTIGFLVVISGVILINGDVLNGVENPLGMICGLLSAVMYAFMVIFNKKAAKITGMENATLQLLISFLTVAIAVAFKQGFALNIALGDIGPIFVLGFINTGIGCFFYFSSIVKLPVQTIAIWGYIELLSAVLLSFIFLRESMLPLQIIGAILILGGAVFVECVQLKRKDTENFKI